MTEQGKILLAAINQVRDYFEKISLLLATADSLMEEQGWQPAQGSATRAYGSAAIYAPRQWLPYELFRFYKHDSIKYLLACVCVIIDNSDGQNEIEEPLISGIIFNYKPKSEIDHWENWYARWHLSAPNRKDNGEIIDFDPNIGREEKDRYPVSSIHSLAQPLIMIQDSDSLKDNIILKLLRLVEGYF